MSTAPHLPTRPARFVRACARAAARRPKRAIALWMTLVVACLVAGNLAGTRSLSPDAGVGQSARAQSELQRAGLQDPATEQILVRSASPAQTSAAIHALTRRARALTTVAGVAGPGDTPGLSRAGGRTGLLVVTLRGDPNRDDDHVAALERLVGGVGRAMPAVSIQEYGDGSVGHAVDTAVTSGLVRSEMIQAPVTLLILVLAFGALVAASVPLILGLTSVAATMGALGLVSHLIPSGETTSSVVVLIGLAVGVDYSLFYIRRERAERHAGAGPQAALNATAATVGRAILVAGATVIIGMAGLLFTGFGVFTSLAAGAILVVAIAVIGSLTVLPAVLALLGERVDRGRLPWRRRRRDGRRTGWTRAAAAICGHPRVALACAIAMLAGLAVPMLHMRTGDPGDRELPSGTPVIVAEHAIARAFPGTSDTGVLVVTGRHLGTPPATHRLAALGERGETITGGRGPVTVTVAADGDTARVTIPVPDGTIALSREHVAVLRRVLLPATGRALPGAHAAIGGADAAQADFTARLDTVTPWVIAFVLGLAFVLVTLSFGSPLLALAVMALNLLSVGAAFGVLTAVFQGTWAQTLLHFTSSGAIVDWLPLFAFVVLFGLSMDYTVLVLERAAEARRAGAGARQAAAEALAATGSTVTSAALVMIAVFATDALAPLLSFKQLGVGLAAAIAIDATVVRTLALPALLTLLGDRGLPAAVRRRGAAVHWMPLRGRATILEAGHE